MSSCEEMFSRYISSSFIKKATGSNGVKIAVEIANTTNTWIRPKNYPLERIKECFAKAALENAHKIQKQCHHNRDEVSQNGLLSPHGAF